MSVRLNENMRTIVLSRLMKHAFSAREEELAKTRLVHGLAVYSDIYSIELQKQMWALPEGFFEMKNGIIVSFGGEVVSVCWGKELPISAQHSYHPAKVYDAKNPLTEEYHELGRKTRLLREENGKAECAARAALKSCTSIKTLLEIWPEAEPFVRDFAAPIAVKALTLSIKDLNSQLGLGR